MGVGTDISRFERKIEHLEKMLLEEKELNLKRWDSNLYFRRQQKETDRLRDSNATTTSSIAAVATATSAVLVKHLKRPKGPISRLWLRIFPRWNGDIIEDEVKAMLDDWNKEADQRIAEATAVDPKPSEGTLPETPICEKG